VLPAGGLRYSGVGDFGLDHRTGHLTSMSLQKN
jgi:hypothetical protein